MSKLGEAVRDLRYLLNQGYPRSSAVNFVSNHYRLKLEERNLLARCVFSKQEVSEHLKKAVKIRSVRGKKLGVDGYNVLITVESIISGKRVIKCDDGYTRDLRAIFGKYRSTRATGRAISLLIDRVGRAGPETAVFFFDKQVSRSGELAALVRREMNLKGLKGTALAIVGVDMKLRAFDVVASSDRAVIKRAGAIWDIPVEILNRKKADVLVLRKF